MNKERISRGFVIGAAGGILIGLVDAFEAVVLARGGLPDTAMMTFLLSVFLWGAIGGAAAVVGFSLVPELGPETVPSTPKTRFFPFIARGFLHFASAVLIVSTLAFVCGRPVVFLLGTWDIRGKTAGGLATALAVLILGLGSRKLGPRARLRLLRIGGAIGLGVIALVLFSSGEKAKLERLNTGDRSPSVRRKAPGRAQPNVILIALDTVRADRLSLDNDGRETTPFLRRMAEEGTVYEKAISPSAWTIPAHASVFTGQYPSVHQATYEHRWLSPELPTLAEILKGAGYATAGFSSNPNVSSLFNFQQGFDDFYEIFRIAGLWVNPGFDALDQSRILKYVRAVLGSPRLKPSDRAALATQGVVSQWLDSWEQREKGKPFFIFINYMPAHLPYHPPEPFLKRFLKEPPSPHVRTLMSEACYPEAWDLMAYPSLMKPADYAQLAAAYDGEIAFLDSCLDNLIAMFRERGLLDNTVVVFFGDHGDNLGEHGGLLNHSFSIHQTLIHVPLIVRFPGAFDKNRRVAGLVSTGSIFPTILKLAGATPAGDWPSAFDLLPAVRSLTEKETGSAYVISEYETPILDLNALAEVPGADVRKFNLSQRAIQSGSLKMVFRSDGTSSLYDFSVDPSEDHPVDPRSSPEGERLQKILADWVVGLRIPAFASTKPSKLPDKAARDLLRSLGYVR